MLFDAHCHMQDNRLTNELDAVMARAKAVRVDGMACCGTCEDDWARVRNLCSRYPRMMIPAFGLHPWHIGQRSTRWLNQLAEFLTQDARAGVGEIGLDHAIKNRNDTDQAEVFTAQLKLANDLGRPVSLHCRKAWEELLSILTGTGAPARGFVVHSYSGPVELIESLARLGAYFSFSGSITRSRNIRGHRAVAAVPADRLLIETDAPDLMPCVNSTAEPGEAELNEPANIVHVLRRVAALRNMDEQALAELTWRNTRRLFCDP